MTQLTHAEKVARWRDAVQTRLMAALDAAWRVIETTDDPVRLRAARDKAKACGELALCVRKVAGLSLRPGGRAKASLPVSEEEALAAEIEAAAMVAEVVGVAPAGRERKLGRLKGGRRGRL